MGYGRLSDDLSKVTDFRTVFRQMPKLSTGNHFGGRMVFDGKGYLFIALGENNQRPTAQDLDKLQGKLVRLTDLGEILVGSEMCIRDSYKGIWCARRDLVLWHS